MTIRGPGRRRDGVSADGGLTAIVADARTLEGAARQAYVARACAGDLALRQEVESLLAEEETVAWDGTPATAAPAPRAAEQPVGQGAHGSAAPERIGRYRIVTRLGEGGMGTVYLADQDEPVKRRVALKVIRVLHQPSLRRRFAAECQALARLSHPNVAAMYEVGQTDDGLPYVVMEWIDGQRITEWCDMAEAGVDARLRLFLGVCAGIKHAHEKGILHCDLKPSNVLVTRVTGAEVVKVIDFGIARALDGKLLEESQVTQELVLGSPPYLSPEAMTVGGRRHLDTRADVYSLGLILYQLLIGVLPFDTRGQTVWSLLERLKKGPVPTPSERLAQLAAKAVAEVAKLRRTTHRRLARRLTGDLDAIVLKAIARDPELRYGTPGELAADLERHLGHRLVTARARTLPYRLGRFTRRNAGTVVATFLLVAALGGGLVARTVEARRANTEAARAKEALAESEQVRRLMIDLFEGADPERLGGAAISARELLDQGAARLRDELADQPLLRARFLQTIGTIYTKLGELQLAADAIAGALDTRRRHHGDRHPEVIESESELGVIYRRLGQLDAAEPFLVSVVAARREDPEVEPELLARAHSNLGNLYWNQQRYADAEVEHRQALALRERVSARRRDRAALDNLARSANNLGVLYQDLRRYEEAGPLLRQAAELFREAYGDQHPNVAAALNNLGLVERNLATWKEAEDLFRQAVVIWTAAYGAGHANTLLGRRNLVTELDRRHRWPQALAEARSVVESAEEIDSPSARVGALRLLGDTERRAGRPEPAVTTLRRAVAVAEAELGTDHPETLASRAMLALALDRAGQVDAALAMLDAVAGVQDRSYASDHPSRLRTEMRIGLVLARAGRHAEAEARFRRYLDSHAATHGDDHPRVGAGLYRLGRSVAAQGRDDEATVLLERALAIGRGHYGAAHPAVADAAHQLGEVLARRGELARARELLAEAERIRRATYPPDDRDLRASAEALARLGS